MSGFVPVTIPSMKAIIQDRYGPPDVLRLEDVERPVPADDEVLIRVRATSVNAADLDALFGRPAFARPLYGVRRPKHRIPGMDVAGEVVSVGRLVTRFKPGDAVFGDLTNSGMGAFAEYVCGRERVLAPKPVSMTFEQASTIPQSAIIALQGLRGRRPIRTGDQVLINGASGNVGPFAVQIARSFGAEVTGVCRTSKIDFVRSLGVDHVIDYTAQDVTRGGVRYDWILDATAPHSLRAWRRVLAPDGTYVMIGGPGRRILTAMAVGPLIRLTGRQRMGLLLSWKPSNLADLAILTAMFEAGTIAPVSDRTYSLREIPDALRYLHEGRACGKLVITVA